LETPTAIVYRFASLTYQRSFLRLPKAVHGPWYVFIKEHNLLAECQRTPSPALTGGGVFLMMLFNIRDKYITDETACHVNFDKILYFGATF
jgi:hypothetical protein